MKKTKLIKKTKSALLPNIKEKELEKSDSSFRVRKMIIKAGVFQKYNMQ